MDFFPQVSCKYGAPMGRSSNNLGDIDNKRVHLVRARMSADNCFDSGGAYWGSGVPLWACAWVEPDTGTYSVAYFRAPSREAAKAYIRECAPEARFFR